MTKICHIRCNENYWEDFNVYKSWTTSTEFSFYKQITDYWDKGLNIKYLEFRKNIRDVVLQQIHNSNTFDIIIENNQQCRKYFTKNNSENIVFYQQDDDDIFLDLPPLSEMSSELNIYRYCSIDPISGRRGQGYRTRNILNKHNKKEINSIQSNHCIIYNKKNGIDINKYSLYNAGHTQYDTIKHNHTYSINNYIISIQFYHLHSYSLWKNIFKKINNEPAMTFNDFMKKAENYIQQIKTIYLENLGIPLIKDFYNLYNKLL
jgi:hypothetical protein